VLALDGTPTEQVAHALLSRGFVKGTLADNQGGGDYTAVVELEGLRRSK